jgi:sugar lactone lactonase YvrE
MARHGRFALLLVLATAAGAIAYFLFWPLPVSPVAWTAPADAGYVGPHAANQRLAGLNLIDLGGEVGPEHVAAGPDGWLYAAVESGNILRLRPDGSGREVFAHSSGRVLGFDFDATGNLIAADAMRGLLRIDRQGRVELLADRVSAGDPIVFADAVVVARDGRIYLSDASTRFSPSRWGGTFGASLLDILEQRSSGRILEFDPASRALRVVARGLSFPNGVALSTDQRTLWVAETGRYRVWAIARDGRDLDLSGGPSSGAAHARVVLDNLPGYPDNLMSGGDGRLWLGFTKPRNQLIDHLAAWPQLRAIVLRLPRAWWPVPAVYGHVIAFDEQGKVLLDLQDPTGAYPEATGVSEMEGRCFVHSLHARALGWFACARPSLAGATN